MDLIEIRRGDSSEFFYDIELTIETDLDLTGWVGYFQVGTLKPIPYNDVSSKVLTISLNSQYTSLLRVGTYTGYLKLVTPSGLVGTLEPICTIKILPEVVNVK